MKLASLLCRLDMVDKHELIAILEVNGMYYADTSLSDSNDTFTGLLTPDRNRARVFTDWDEIVRYSLSMQKYYDSVGIEVLKYRYHDVLNMSLNLYTGTMFDEGGIESDA